MADLNGDIRDINLRAGNILNTYVCTDPLGRRPLETEQTSTDLDKLLGIFQVSIDYFSRRDRSRTVERLYLETARAKMSRERWSEALHLLLPLWRKSSWRRSGWYDLLGELCWMVRDCARLANDQESLVAAEWELLCLRLKPRAHHEYDFGKCLNDIGGPGSKPKIVTSSNDSLTCITAKFAFTIANGHVGETLPFQIVLTSSAHQNSSPIDLSRLCLAFGGGLRNVILEHDSRIECQASSTDGMIQSYTPSMDNLESNNSQGSCNLRLRAGASKVFFLSALPLDAGRIEVSKISLCIEVERFDFEISLLGADYLHQSSAWNLDDGRIIKSNIQLEQSTTIEVMPKSPKIRIELPNVLKAYFTGESVFLDIEVTNDEDEESRVEMEASFIDQASTPPALRWVSTQERTDRENDETCSAKTSLGLIPSSEKRHLVLNFQAESETAQHTLEIVVRYCLLSDPGIPVSKVVSIDMLVMRPFEGNFDFTPEIHETPWPNYFHVDQEASLPYCMGTDIRNMRAKGLCQRWAVKAAIASFATTDLVLDAVDLQLAKPAEQAICTILRSATHHSASRTLSPHEVQERQFIMDLQKASLDDYRTTYFDLRLQITWRRNTAGATSATTYLRLPEFTVPFGEPRVLASKVFDMSTSRKVDVNYMIENPSAHVLSFSVTMDASEDFAFSGAKATSVQLVPYSRLAIRYSLLPLVQGKWIEPQMRIVDVHWNKTLKINATGDTKSGEKGISIWIDGKE